MVEGIFEGVAGSAVFAVLVFVFTEQLLPIIRGRLRKLPKLNETEWHRETDDNNYHTVSILRIRQSGTRIDATITRTKANVRRQFRYRGFLSGHDMVLTWEDIDSPEVVVGAMVLHLSADIKKLSGQSVYFRQNQGKVVSVPRIYVRA